MVDVYPPSPLANEAMFGVLEIGSFPYAADSGPYDGTSTIADLVAWTELSAMRLETYQVASGDYNNPTAAWVWVGRLLAAPALGPVELGSFDEIYQPLVQLLSPSTSVAEPNGVNWSRDFRHSFDAAWLRPFRGWVRSLFCCCPQGHLSALRSHAVQRMPSAAALPFVVPFSRSPIVWSIRGVMEGETPIALPPELADAELNVGGTLGRGTALPPALGYPEPLPTPINLNLPALRGLHVLPMMLAVPVTRGPRAVFEGLGEAIHDALVANSAVRLHFSPANSGKHAQAKAWADALKLTVPKELADLVFEGQVNAWYVVESADPNVEQPQSLQHSLVLGGFKLLLGPYAEEYTDFDWPWRAPSRIAPSPSQYAGDIYSAFALARGSWWDKVWLDWLSLKSAPAAAAGEPFAINPAFGLSLPHPVLLTYAQTIFSVACRLFGPSCATWSTVEKAGGAGEPAFSSRWDGLVIGTPGPRTIHGVAAPPSSSDFQFRHLTRQQSISAVWVWQPPTPPTMGPLMYWAPTPGNARRCRLAVATVQSSGRHVVRRGTASQTAISEAEGVLEEALQWTDHFVEEKRAGRLQDVLGLPEWDILAWSGFDPKTEEHEALYLLFSKDAGLETVQKRVLLGEGVLDWAAAALADGPATRHPVLFLVLVRSGVLEAYLLDAKVLPSTGPLPEPITLAGFGSMASAEIRLSVGPETSHRLTRHRGTVREHGTGRRVFSLLLSYRSAGIQPFPTPGGVPDSGPKQVVALGQVEPDGVPWFETLTEEEGTWPVGVLAAGLPTTSGTGSPHDTAVGAHSVYVAITYGAGTHYVMEYLLPPALRDGHDDSPAERILNDEVEDWSEMLSDEILLALRESAIGGTLPLDAATKSGSRWIAHPLHMPSVYASSTEVRLRIAYTPAHEPRITKGAAGMLVVWAATAEVSEAAVCTFSEGGWRNYPVRPPFEIAPSPDAK